MERMTDVMTNWTQTFMEGNAKYQALINKAQYNQQQLGILIAEAKCRKSRDNILVSTNFSAQLILFGERELLIQKTFRKT